MSTTIATPGGVVPSGMGTGRHVIWAVNSARWWAFAFTSTTVIASYYSSDGVTWTAGATQTVNNLTTNSVIQDGRNLWVGYKSISGIDIAYIGFVYGIAATNANVAAVRATLSGTVCTYHTTDSNVYQAALLLTNTWYGGSVEFTSGNLVFLADTLVNGTGDTACARSTADPGTAEQATPVTWAGTNANIDTGSADNRSNYIADTGATTMLLLADNEGSDTGLTEVRTYAWSGSAWGANVSATGTITSVDKNDWGAVARTTSDVHVVYRSGTNTYVHRRWNGTTWGAGTAIPTQNSLAGGGVPLASDGTSVWLFVIDTDAPNTVRYVQWNGTSWGSWTALESTTQTRTFVGCSKTVSNSQILTYWSQGTSLVATALSIAAAPVAATIAYGYSSN